MVLKNHPALKDTRYGGFQSETEKIRKGEQQESREEGEKHLLDPEEASCQVAWIHQGKDKQYHRTGKETWISPGGSHPTHRGNCWQRPNTSAYRL